MGVMEIARAANVSYAMAWRIINNRPCASPEAVESVRRAMKEIGYAPPKGGRRGRPSKRADGIRTRNVALLHLRPGTTLSTAVVDAVQRMLAERDLNLLYACSLNGVELPQAVRSGNVDGILGYGQFPEEKVTPVIEGIPAVWMMSRSDRSSDRFGDRVRPDHVAIGYMAARHLVARGHRHMAVLNPDPGSEIYRLRCEAFAAEARAGGVRVDVILGAGSGDLEEEAGRMVGEWLASRERSTGIFVPADVVAAPAYRYLRGGGVRIGSGAGEVEVASSDADAEVLSTLRPAPASVDLNRESIARVAVERLFWRMRHGTSSPQVVIDVKPTLVLPRRAEERSDG